MAKKSKSELYIEKLDQILNELRAKLDGTSNFLGQTPKLYFKGKIDGLKVAIEVFNKTHPKVEKTNDSKKETL